MGNMSYCRFENTSGDLQDCYDNFDDIDVLSEGELKARKRIIRLACDIAQSYGEEVNNYVKIEHVEP